MLFLAVMALTCAYAAPAAALVYADRPAPVSQDDLDQLVAPVALYPDPLLAHVLAASTYPVEVAEAARFVTEQAGLRGQALAREIRSRGWEPNVSALLQFPTVLDMMRENDDWVRRLGDVMLREPTAVLDTVQTLRALALNQGSLRSSREQNVYTSGDIVTIEPADADELCVPIYDAATIYGAWWLPDQPPLSWRPRRQGPRVHDMLSAGISFAPCDRLAVTQGLGAAPDWESRRITVSGRDGVEDWVHDPAHRRGAPYPTAALRAHYEARGPGFDTGIRRAPGGATGVTIIRPKTDSREDER
ncbi:MAG: DUF3300 domain-containing protein [Sphingomonadales bacterium]